MYLKHPRSVVRGTLGNQMAPYKREVACSFSKGWQEDSIDDDKASFSFLVPTYLLLFLLLLLLLFHYSLSVSFRSLLTLGSGQPKQNSTAIITTTTTTWHHTIYMITWLIAFYFI
ncbi:hypothetical protein F4809DRAFT_126576 [Biscogniauxia mediterranea]|nr:hypothetical protein F4809DRAFT_126576 [Biscogniauxia mediterranea]